MENTLDNMHEKTLHKLKNAIETYNENESDVIERYKDHMIDETQMVEYLLTVRQRKNDLIHSLLFACKELLCTAKKSSLKTEDLESIQAVYRGLYICSDLGSDDLENQ